MGWFSRAVSSVSSAVSSGWKRVGKVVGSVAEKAGEITGIKILENAGRALKDWCSEVGEYRSYDKDTASAADTANINELLTLFSTKLKDQADELEKNALDEIRDYFEDVISQIEDSGVPVQTKQFRRAMTQTERQIKGQLKSHLAKRVSIDDQECLDILSLSAGAEKSQKMDKFGQRVLKEGLGQLAEMIEKTVNKYNDELQGLLNQLLEQQEKELVQTQNQFNEMLLQADGDLVDKEAAKLKPAIMLQSINHLEKLLA
ncbi:hypothetical protein [Niallia hominis]|uniref:Uncharacterized protein n=1 Tax=Niallia hominis TaxID=3133173 RepID=A0ABV1ESU5_9BACI